MGEVERYPDGSFCWIDLGTTDVEGAKAFYGGLLGWEFEDLPAPEGSYTMCRLRGRDVAGIHRHAEEEGTGWSSNVSVGDLDRATARTRELGAEVDRSPCGSGSAARVAVLDARGDLGPGQTLVHDSIVGSTFRCRVVDSLTADGHRP